MRRGVEAPPGRGREPGPGRDDDDRLLRRPGPDRRGLRAAGPAAAQPDPLGRGRGEVQPRRLTDGEPVRIRGLSLLVASAVALATLAGPVAAPASADGGGDCGARGRDDVCILNGGGGAPGGPSNG